MSVAPLPKFKTKWSRYQRRLRRGSPIRRDREARVAIKRYLGWHDRAAFEVEHGEPHIAVVRELMATRAWKHREVDR